MILGEKTFINFGARIEAARKKKGLTQEELAALLTYRAL